MTGEVTEEPAQPVELPLMDEAEAIPGASVTAPKRENQRSTIAFPYNDLDDAVEVAEAIAGHYGRQCTFDQLAAQLGHDNVGSGTFRLKVAAARQFGLIETDRELATLTDLGRRIVQPQSAPQMKVQAFLHVPLYRALYDQYRGYALPRDVGLEQEMIRLGVAPKQADKARQAFQRSAASAGFFEHGRDKLILPAVANSDDTTVPSEATAQTGAYSSDDRKPPATAFGGGDGPTEIDPFIQGLFRTLPPPGAKWPVEKRRLWLETAERIFGLIYNE